MSTGNYTMHQVLSFLNVVAVLTGLVMSIVISSQVLGSGCDEKDCLSMIYVTTTFLDTRRIETNIGWPVATERSVSTGVQYPLNPNSPSSDRSYRFGHYLECMHTARMADRVCSPDLTFDQYSSCISNSSSLVAVLDQCASFPSTGVYYHWPTSEEYVGCLHNNALMRNSESQRASTNVFRSCVSRSLWPFFEVPQNLDSTVLLGSFNWALLLVVGLVVMTSFGVYQVSYKEMGHVEHGEPAYFMRLGMFWAFIALVWNIVFLVIFLTVGFRGNGELQNRNWLPTTTTTTFVTVLALAWAVAYFLSVALEPFRRRYYWFVDDCKIIPAAVPDEKAASDPERDQKMHLTGTLYTMVNGKTKEFYELGGDDVAQYYTPPLLATWADSYLLDFCIVLGVAGATGQLKTHEAWYLFTFTLIYRILNMIISRCLSDAFTNNVQFDDETNEAKNNIVTRPRMFYHRRMQTAGKKTSHDVHLNTSVIGLSTQLAAFYLYFGILYLVFNPESVWGDYPVFNLFIWFCFLIPEALRLVIHLCYQILVVSSDGVPWVLYNLCFAVWLWDYICRIIFVSVVLIQNTNNPGTLDFLKTETMALMQDTVVSMSI